MNRKEKREILWQAAVLIEEITPAYVTRGRWGWEEATHDISISRKEPKEGFYLFDDAPSPFDIFVPHSVRFPTATVLHHIETWDPTAAKFVKRWLIAESHRLFPNREAVYFASNLIEREKVLQKKREREIVWE